MSELIELTDESFEEQVLEAAGPVLVLFWAPWCRPCKMLFPLLEELHNDVLEPKLKLCQLDIEKERKIFHSYGLANIPALILFVDGQIHSQKIGPVPRFVLRRWMAEVR